MSIYVYSTEQIDILKKDIKFYNDMINFSVCPMAKLYYYKIILKKMELLLNLNDIDKQNYITKRYRKTFTLKELSNYDGSSGKPAYIAINNSVYDVSAEATWGGASHFGLTAGKDLTNEFNSCHKNLSILNKLPLIGTIID